MHPDYDDYEAMLRAMGWTTSRQTYGEVNGTIEWRLTAEHRGYTVNRSVLTSYAELASTREPHQVMDLLQRRAWRQIWESIEQWERECG